MIALTEEAQFMKERVKAYEVWGRGRVSKEVPVVMDPFNFNILTSKEHNPLIDQLKQRLLNFTSE